MNRVTLRSVFLVSAVTLSNVASAGGLSVEAIGAKPMSMGGAFTSIADSPEAVYYNPAGLTQISETTINAGAVYLYAKNDYTHVGGTASKSREYALAPSVFASWKASLPNLSRPIHFGFGVYAPFARIADYGDGVIGGMQDAYGEALRKDYSLTASYQLSDQLSVGGG